jgi:hypothetical protein
MIRKTFSVPGPNPFVIMDAEAGCGGLVMLGPAEEVAA